MVKIFIPSSYNYRGDGVSVTDEHTGDGQFGVFLQPVSLCYLGEVAHSPEYRGDHHGVQVGLPQLGNQHLGVYYQGSIRRSGLEVFG